MASGGSDWKQRIQTRPQPGTAVRLLAANRHPGRSAALLGAKLRVRLSVSIRSFADSTERGG
jgi:hypothetical protein